MIVFSVYVWDPLRWYSALLMLMKSLSLGNEVEQSEKPLNEENNGRCCIYLLLGQHCFQEGHNVNDYIDSHVFLQSILTELSTYCLQKNLP